MSSLSNLTIHSIGGGWGKDVEDEGLELVAVIRGTDIPNLEINNIQGVPFRYETQKKIQSRLLQIGDLVIEISGGSASSKQRTGRCLYITDELLKNLGGKVIPASFCKLLRLDRKKVNSKYVYYQIKAMHLSDEIASFENQSTGISNFQFNRFIDEIRPSILDIEVQNKIVNFLEKIDLKIINNININQTLEQIAQTIFKSWFIDFDPVHAKANALASGQAAEQATQAAMAVISGKNTQELHRLQTANPEQYQQLWEIAEAFPSGFDEEGVPWGWEEKSFGELLENTIGGDWGKDEVDEKHTEKVSILRGTDLPDVYKGNDKDVPTRFVEQKKLKSRKLQHSDIVIEVSGGSKNQPTGRSLLITDKLLSRFNNPIVPASFCRLFRPKSENYGYLLALHLQIIYQQGKTWEYQNQSTGISNFQTTHFLETEKVILPTNKTLMYFAEMVYPIFDKIYSNENQKLTEIRDELLPKLLSGEILNGN
ncbi:restriction endonuclease subunit S [Glaesserella parasuis]|uniref:restriction endonuclease subunit S n=1 Tax=Glaesserella parasuis TaxID=738 RepID=UPI003CEABD61